MSLSGLQASATH
jgi:phosphomannomutase